MVVIVAVVIATALAITIWVGGIASHYTRFDNIEVIISQVTRDEEEKRYEITIRFRNSGSADTTITTIFINGKPMSDFWSASLVNGTEFTEVPVRAGEEKLILISLVDEGLEGDGKQALSSGQMLHIDLYTSSGKTYLCTIPVP